jgi:hypothetical protein
MNNEEIKDETPTSGLPIGNTALGEVLLDVVRQRLDELEIHKWWDYGDFEEIRDKDHVAWLIVEDVLKHIA